jgi:simple sugar transport system ATP-binding protein
MTREPTGAAPALALENISKQFGSMRALQDVSLHVRAGTVHALLGENGAGKSTLLRIAYGLLRADAGAIRVGGRVTPIARPADAIAAGIGMVHQHFTLVPSMTVAENLALGGRGRLAIDDVARRVREVATATGFALDPDARVEDLGVSAQQRVEIAKALIRDARLLVLDEPTAVLAPADTVELLRWLRSFAASGRAVVIITHKLREALDVAADVTVLRAGRVVLTAPASSLTDRSLGDAMIGAGAVGAMPASAVAKLAVADDVREAVFRADRITIGGAGRPRVRDASFVVRAGEIVGVAGLEGSGHRELLRALAGRIAPDSGSLTRPSAVGFIPEDRHHDAVLLDRSLAENVALRGAGRRRGLLDWRAVHLETERLLRAFDVRAPDARASMRSLSGGNQQKLVLARELPSSTPPHSAGAMMALVAENPTRGLDVRATAEVHARLRAVRDDGAAVVLYSSDLDEVLALATRVLVAYAGTIREVALDRAAVGRAMLGVA